MNKKGISIIVLLITVVLIVILTSMITIEVGNSIRDARKVSFANELTKIEDSLELYYTQNGTFPVLEENGKNVEYVYNEIELSSKTSEKIALNPEFLTEFKEELVNNLDLTEGESIVSDTVFYKIDLAKLGILNTRLGTGKDGENDIFVMAYPSLNVYYIKGVKVEDSRYFSLANLSSMNKVEKVENEVIELTESGLTVLKDKKAWTNNLGINIKANLNANEKIYVKLPVRDEEIALSTTDGENNITINSLSGSLSMTDEEVTAFNKLDSNQKIMNVIKRNDGVETANIKVDISNYETIAPTFPLKADGKTFDFSIESLDGYNKVSFKGNDNLSGIKEVKYVYLTEFGNKLSINTLISDTSILTNNYMLENGKSAYVSNSGNVEIKLPKDIEAIYITMFDKAGNFVSMQKNVSTDTYIGINAINISNNLKFNIAFKSTKEISSAKAWISLDGKNYIDEKVLEYTKDVNNVYNSMVEFQNTQDKEVYIKVAIYDNSETTNEEVRIKKFYLEEIATSLISSAIPGLTYEENRWYTDENSDKAIIPAGFRVSTKSDEQIINDGLVILDKNDNEFVWIPCTLDGANGTVKYAKWCTAVHPYNETAISDDDLPNGIAAETEQITKYKGFYISRYEAGVPENQTIIDGTNITTSDTIGVPISKPNVKIWTCIGMDNAKATAENMYDNQLVKSGLVTGIQWDTVCKWLQNSNINVESSISWGNHINSVSPANVQGFGEKQISGFSEFWKSNNIYDLAGNVLEWSNEWYHDNSYRVVRGGNYELNGMVLSASSRSYTNNGRIDIGFRVVLYIM